MADILTLISDADRLDFPRTCPSPDRPTWATEFSLTRKLKTLKLSICGWPTELPSP